MLRLYRQAFGDQEETIAAFIRAEDSGEVPRPGNLSHLSADEHARGLLMDGLTKGWIGLSAGDAAIKARRPAGAAAPVLRKATERPAAEAAVVADLTADERTDIRRRLTALAFSLDPLQGADQTEGLHRRIARLADGGGPIPADIGAAMLLLERHTGPTPPDATDPAVRRAWQAVQSWAARRDGQ